MAQDEVLTPQDVKELAPLYEDVVLSLKQVYDPESRSISMTWA